MPYCKFYTIGILWLFSHSASIFAQSKPIICPKYDNFMQNANELQKSNRLAKALVEFRNAQIAAGQCHISLIESTAKIKETLEMIGKQRADAEEARLKMEQSRLKLELEQRKAELAKQKVKALEQEVKEAAAVCDLNVKASTRALRDSLATVQASRVGQLSTELRQIRQPFG